LARRDADLEGTWAGESLKGKQLTKHVEGLSTSKPQSSDGYGSPATSAGKKQGGLWPALLGAL
jgi:hypothetical protein